MLTENDQMSHPDSGFFERSSDVVHHILDDLAIDVDLKNKSITTF